jgi:membrane protein YqaA with SNARE-associated domain
VPRKSGRLGNVAGSVIEYVIGKYCTIFLEDSIKPF